MGDSCAAEVIDRVWARTPAPTPRPSTAGQAAALEDQANPASSTQPRPIGVASSIEQAALNACVAELFVCPPSDGRVWIVVGQRLHEIVLAVGEQSF